MGYGVYVISDTRDGVKTIYQGPPCDNVVLYRGSSFIEGRSFPPHFRYSACIYADKGHGPLSPDSPVLFRTDGDMRETPDRNSPSLNGKTYLGDYVSLFMRRYRGPYGIQLQPPPQSIDDGRIFVTDVVQFFRIRGIDKTDQTSEIGLSPDELRESIFGAWRLL